MKFLSSFAISTAGMNTNTNADAGVASDPGEIRRIGKELARLEPVVAAFRELSATREELAGARELRDSESDAELRAMAQEEIARLEADEVRLTEELKVLLLPRDPNDDRNVIMEIRAGAGGDEAGLFAAELLRMYLRYAERRRFAAEVMSLNESGIGGIKEAIVEVTGDGAYSRLKFEGGVHRVQRIPATESSGRIHTSTATVVVMPEAERRISFFTQPVWKRAAIVAAGPIANFILSIVIFSGIYLWHGQGMTVPRIDSVQAGSPAEGAGFSLFLTPLGALRSAPCLWASWRIESNTRSYSSRSFRMARRFSGSSERSSEWLMKASSRFCVWKSTCQRTASSNWVRAEGADWPDTAPLLIMPRKPSSRSLAVLRIRSNRMSCLLGKW